MALITVFETQNITGFSLNSFYGVFVSSVSPMPFQLVDGEEYVVFWDSDSFTRTAFSFNGPDGSTCIGVGNKMAYTGEDDGDPFVIVCDYTNSYTHFMAKNTNTEHEVGVHISDGGNMVLKDRPGTDMEGIESVVELRVPTSGGKFQSFVGGVRTNKTLHSNEVDFSVGDIVITPRKGEVFGTVTVPKPPALLPENIMEGVTIAGVDGTAKGGGDEPILTKPIQFYNAYGDVLFSFSRAEMKKMTELPEGPALGNLVFDKWDYTLEELQSIMYFCNVSPQYKNSAGQAVAAVIVNIVDPTVAMRINYRLTTSGARLYADWGDGSTTYGGYGSSYTSSTTSLSHTYSEKGIYVISFYATGLATPYSSARIGTGSVNNGQYTVSGSSMIQTSNITNGNGTVPAKNVISIVGNAESFTAAGWCGSEHALHFASGLDMNITSSGRFLNCGSLRAVGKIITDTVYGFSQNVYGDRMFSGCSTIKRVQVTQTSANMFDYCTDLAEVEILGKGNLACNEMNVRFSMLMKSTTPNKITATAPEWGTKPIYVPDEAVDAYKTASGWSDAAAYIFPASEYPDK